MKKDQAVSGYLMGFGGIEWRFLCEKKIERMGFFMVFPLGIFV